MSPIEPERAAPRPAASGLKPLKRLGGSSVYPLPIACKSPPKILLQELEGVLKYVVMVVVGQFGVVGEVATRSVASVVPRGHARGVGRWLGRTPLSVTHGCDVCAERRK